MKTAAKSRLLLIAVAVMAGLIVSASEIRALSSETLGAAPKADLASMGSGHLPFLEGAPHPMALVALGTLVIGVTLARRLRKGDSRA